MTHHLIVMDTADANRQTYGITHQSRNVYRTAKSSGPTRLVIWSNVNRPNVDKGKHLGDTLEVGDRRGNRVTEYNYSLTRGAYLDPHNQPTDSAHSLLLTPECSVICANTDMNTGQPGSGQVYAPEILADQDTATCIYPNGTTVEVLLHFPPHHNGHGYATITSRL
jgi:hypothetical protein